MPAGLLKTKVDFHKTNSKDTEFGPGRNFHQKRT